MPPLRRRSRVKDRNVVADAALLNGYSVQQLRNLCRQKKIASTGNKATLLNRLRGPGPLVTASNVNVRANLREPNLPAYEGADPQDHVVNASANDITFSERQLNTIRQLVRVCRCYLKGNRQRSSSGRRSGFAAKFLANSFKS